ncbi:pullulanase-type alpha-1,6-glucosidase [Arthrobacter sp. CAN_A212]|uniref:pullulanase-type alpha-1,6-glucosidase n=1 Tax=unclassified Arthrobacter TaxID=235627 RepID=UPI0018CA90F6|nr:pullulanase-type alpha-1,6-glucosidase [Arthrobacter sp. CAN_C5]MBP2216704.1 pullulanase-type alpha-1,6-glucosidase [Arthrobacter sp. CAN_C5]
MIPEDITSVPRAGSRPSLKRHTRLAAAILVAPLLATLMPVSALADHTEVPNTVAVVGSLQSELGCPGDWQPECAATRLVPVEGSPDTWGGTFDVPAGSYEYKVALDDSWGENYGAGGAAGGANLALQTAGGPVTFTYNHRTHVISSDAPQAATAAMAGHWLAAETLAWDVDLPADTQYRLYTAPDGGLTIEDDVVTGGTYLGLERSGDALPAGLAARYPHLAALDTLQLGRKDARNAGSLLKGQLLLAAVSPDGTVLAATGVQVPGVLDDLYSGAARKELGLTWKGAKPQLDLWAPTARSVSVQVFREGSGGKPITTRALRQDKDGIWSVKGEKGWKNAYYLYDVEVFVPETGAVEHNLVTDPYSVGLSTNSERSLFADLTDPALAPVDWNRVSKPVLDRPEQLSVYELHVRDFSISDTTVPEAERGTYAAFSRQDSDGMKRLSELADSGLKAVHLLPVNDIGTVEEDRSQQAEPACDLASYAPDSTEQQECVAAVAGQDGFNWGYDPLHYTTPEGSYSTNPEDATRIREFRGMVASLNESGLSVVQDIVYNHTAGAGQASSNNLDRIVPGYYHRLNPESGSVETSTCCPNTATEHTMMGKLMIDSIVTLARTYKLDGFRFDLMGHHSKQNILDVRGALDKLTLKHDGIDGKSIYLYGEGWNFGEVADNARFEQATQANMAGTGIGTFNDRLRDAVRGGGPFDEDPRVQGFASGLLTDPNGLEINGTEDEQRARLLQSQDQIRVGLTGNLKDYAFTDRFGNEVTGADVDYNGSPTGYTADPQESITYVEAHDNETLFDALAFKLPIDTPMADRVRMQTLALSTTALGQGVSFWHAGGEVLRSKSLDRNSYDSGDWFNFLDHTGADNGFGRGLPPRADNEDKYGFMKALLADPTLKPSPTDIEAARTQAEELLRIRESSPLFSLGTADLVQQKLSFPGAGLDQAPGVIVMHLDDTTGPDFDPERKGIVVVFNASDETTAQQVPAAIGKGFALHTVQAEGGDKLVRHATADANGVFTVPARTVAVFEAK